MVMKCVDPPLQLYAFAMKSCTSTLRTHLLTAQIEHPQAKDVFHPVLGVGVLGAVEGEVQVADSGAAFHVTGAPTFMLSLIHI